MSSIRKVRRYIYENSELLRRFWFYFQFYKRNGYVLTTKSVQTFNQKVNLRKSSPNNPKFSICSDKIAVKEWLESKGYKDILIPNYHVTDSVSFDEVKKIISEKGDVLLKANHNSGPVYLLTKACSDNRIIKACDDVNNQLSQDYGAYKKEPWYSDIVPRILIEQRLHPEEGDSELKDYKFHVFKQVDGSMKVILHIDFNRSSNHSRSFFDDELNWIPMSNTYPSIITKIEKPRNFELMVQTAKELAEEFSYARVDFYNVNGKIFFGELTFAHESGAGPFNSIAHDKWMGKWWQLDPRT